MNSVSPLTLLLSSLAYFSGNLDLSEPFVEVDIAQGRLRGVKNIARNGKIYMEFLGIPFAQPPLGDLRFEPPQPPSSWEGVRQATTYGKACLQYEFLTHFKTGHEDCLNLNVYTHQVYDGSRKITPKLRRRVSSSSSSQTSGSNLIDNSSSGLDLKPVIVYFHGGLFMSGFTYVYRAKYLMEQEDVVLVTLNYRVNSFGFLNTGDEVVRGNMGLKDQAMALKWVQQNIARFGGDPNQVTIMGQSAGAASVHYHMLSPRSTGLFRNAISQSGTALSSWAFSQNPKEQARRLASSLNCPTSNTTRMIACLKTKGANEIIRFHKEYLDPAPDPLTIFSPSAEAVNDEDTFISDTPRNLLEKRSVANKVPWIVGVNNGEGYLCALYLMKTTARFNQFAKNMKRFIPQLLSYESHPNKTSISNQIYDYYFNEKLVKSIQSESLVHQLAKMYSDIGFFRGIHDSIKLMSPITTVYPYYFTYAGDSGITSIQMRMFGNGLPRLIDFGIGTRQKWLAERLLPQNIRHYGVAHADELIYQFNIPVIAEEITPGSRNYEFSREFIQLWLSFIKNGRPSKFINTIWKPSYSSRNATTTIEYLRLNEEPKMIPEPFTENVKFWKSLNIDQILSKS